MNRVVRMIAVGDELLEGRTADTNSGRIQRALGQHAVQVAGIQVVPDTEEAISTALDRTGSGDIVFLTGGLGSTPDDLTRDMVARWAGAELVEDASVRAELEERWRRLGRKPVATGVQRQCQVPVGMTPVTNPVGSAPGLVGELKGRVLVLLPGVPAELTGLLPAVVSWLKDGGYLARERKTLLWRTGQIAELALVRKLENLRAPRPRLQWSWWLTEWGVDVRLAADPEDAAAVSELEGIQAEVDRELGYRVYSREMKTLPEVVQERLIAAGLTLATGESCTAGLLGARLTDPAGSSGFFRGGILAYENGIKEKLLGVPHADLVAHGAVSQPVVEAMAHGAQECLGTDYALAVSGISGPGGGTKEKPVGTTWLALATPEAVFSHCYRFPGNRERNRLLTVAAAVDTLRRSLDFGPRVSPWPDQDTWCVPQSR